MAGTSTVSGESNLFDYFHDRVRSAKVDLSTELDPDTTLYIAQLLTDRTRTDRPAPSEDTLAGLHALASKSAPGQKARVYRELGDRSLYALGFFRESLSRSMVGANYYYDMGSAAYGRADVVFKRCFSDAFGPVFTELAQRFGECVGVIDRIRAEQDSSPDVIGRWYDEWLRTGDPDAAARLRRRGILLPAGLWPDS